MSESPLKKRQRTSSNGDSDQRTRSRYWLEDGNIVLQAEDTLFRVHQSILSRQSQIFKDTFAMPQAPSGEDENERVEGCPVVPLSDSAEDLGHIISLLYDLDKMLGFGRKLPVRVAGSMLRLGRKYVIPCLENEVLLRLQHDFPTTLGAWDSSEDRQIGDGNELCTLLTVISIAHEFHLFTILPAAYARYVELLPLDRLPTDTGIPVKARESCILGYVRILEYLKKAKSEALCPPLILPSQTCSRRGKCDASKWNTIQKLPVWETGESDRFGIFGRWEALGPCSTQGLCSRCQAEVKKLTEKVRLEFWASLPKFFGLPAWADLKDEL